MGRTINRNKEMLEVDLNYFVRLKVLTDIERQDLIRRWLIGQYEMLHTQSIEYETEDMAETLINWEFTLQVSH